MKNKILILLLIGFLLFSLFVCTSQTESENDTLAATVKENQLAEAAHPVSKRQYEADPISNSRQNAITRAVEAIEPAVVGINVVQIHEYVGSNSPFNDPYFDHLFGRYRYRRQVPSLGSGFIISSDGYILTNQHVVDNAIEIIVTLTGGKKYEAKIVGEDKPTDIALLKVDTKELSYVTLGNSNDVIIGEWAIAFGNPFGLFDIGAEPSVSVGVISATNRDFERQDNRVYQDMIQTDAAINSGNSGGPLVNSDAEVIGINTFIYSGSQRVGTSIGLGFAIPINRVKRILRALKKHGKVNRQFRTGLEIKDLSRLHARILGLSSTDGVIVSDVEKNSPAARANLEIGDIIIQVDDYQVKTSDDIFKIIQNTDAKGGDILQLTLLRNKRKMVVPLKLEQIPASR
ncbi:MAG: S1C family serine protease [Methanosarcinaceae archaeon]